MIEQSPEAITLLDSHFNLKRKTIKKHFLKKIKIILIF
ncbi:hypothetical protein Bsph_1082 [Lysinibacillus sphaericus C3-41]|uniref:Uncharacterized protein n=1 Tax=Lysinibacillus sphaericus (strain C3-41) TaxID=444177 RepID=B1HMC0_LYSSC|nr:hypothetical protein Bsph_1082 [Lysinibacillus sphaericus C3-41]